MCKYARSDSLLRMRRTKIIQLAETLVVEERSSQTFTILKNTRKVVAIQDKEEENPVKEKEKGAMTTRPFPTKKEEQHLTIKNVELCLIAKEVDQQYEPKLRKVIVIENRHDKVVNGKTTTIKQLKEVRQQLIVQLNEKKKQYLGIMERKKHDLPPELSIRDLIFKKIHRPTSKSQLKFPECEKHIRDQLKCISDRKLSQKRIRQINLKLRQKKDPEYFRAVVGQTHQSRSALNDDPEVERYKQRIQVVKNQIDYLENITAQLENYSDFEEAIANKQRILALAEAQKELEDCPKVKLLKELLEQQNILKEKRQKAKEQYWALVERRKQQLPEGLTIRDLIRTRSQIVNLRDEHKFPDWTGTLKFQMVAVSEKEDRKMNRKNNCQSKNSHKGANKTAKSPSIAKCVV